MNRITALHPDPDKQGTRIAAGVYEATRSAILESLEAAGDDGVAFGDLSGEVERRSDPAIWADRSVGWYTTSVKLDLEARGLIRRSEGRSPQRLFVA